MPVHMKEHVVFNSNQRELVEVKESEDMLSHIIFLSNLPVVKTDWTVDDSQVKSLFNYIVEDTFFITRITALAMTDVFENLSKNSGSNLLDFYSVDNNSTDITDAANESTEDLIKTFTITSRTFEKIDEYHEFGMSYNMAAYFAVIDTHDLMKVSRITELIESGIVVQMDSTSFESTLEMFCVLANQSKNPENVIELFKDCGKTFLMQKELYNFLLNVPAVLVEDADLSKPAVMSFLRNSVGFFSADDDEKTTLNILKIGIKLFSTMEASSYQLHGHYKDLLSARNVAYQSGTDNGGLHKVPSAVIFEECFENPEERDAVDSFLWRMMYNEHAAVNNYSNVFSSRTFGAGGVSTLSIAQSVYAAALVVHGPQKVADAVRFLMEYGKTATLGHLLVLIEDEEAIQDSVIPNYLFVLAGLPELVSEDANVLD